MHKKIKKLLVWSLVVSMVLTNMLFSNFAFAATKSTALASLRLAGADRYQTAVEISKADWTTSQYAVLAYGEGFADALAAGPLAAKYDAPILLTDKNSLPAAVLAELKRLGVKNVFIVGGEGVVSKAVADALTAAGMTPERLAGADRYATALAVANKLGTTTEVVVANGEGFADALSIAAIAAAKGMPILLTDKDAMSADVKAYIGSKKAYVVGGEGVVSAAVFNGLTGAVRLGGPDRYATNLAVLQQFAADLNWLNVFVATGEGFADALAGSALAARYGSPVVLAAGSIAAATSSFLAGKVNSQSGVIAFGGVAVVSDAVVGSVKPVAPTALVVESVTAQNLNFIKVVFSQEVDEAAAETASNYTLGGVDLTAVNTFDLQSDKKTLYISLDVAKAQYETVILKVKGNVVYSKDLLTTAPAKEVSLVFSDVATPTVKSVTVSGNKKLTVEFSEPVKMTAAWLAAAGTNFKIDGQNIVNYGFTSPAVPKAKTTANDYVVKLDLNFATSIPVGNHTLTVAKGSATDLIDAAAFKVAEQTLNFTVSSVTDAPKVVSVTAENNGTIFVTYDRKMDANALTNTHYSVAGVSPAALNPSFKSGSGDTIVKMTITTVVKGANVLEITKDVKDVYGNKLDPDNNVRVSFTATEDKTKPTVTSVTVITNTKLRVKFSEDVSLAYASNVNNYTLKDSSGTTIAIAGGSIVSAPTAGTNSDTYEITVPVLTGSNYTLKIKNVVDLAANPNTIDEYIATFNGSDDVAPTVTSVFAVNGSTTKVAVTFSEKMDAATITDLANYYYEDNKIPPVSRSLPSGTSITAGEDNKSVQIAFPSAYAVNGAANTEYSVMKIRVANVKDVAGNLLSGVATAMTTITAAGSGLDKATYSDKSFKLFADSTKVWAEFELNQAVTSLVVADFTVAGQAADTGYMSGKKVVLNFTTTTKIDAIKLAGKNATLVAAAPTSTNIYGTPIAVIAGQVVYDDQIAPKFVSLAAANGAGAADDTISITFTEPLDATIAGLYKNDFNFELNGTLLTVKSVSVAGAVITYNFDGASFTTGNQVTVKAVAANIDIKDEQDAAENQNLYVPATADTNGSKVVTIP